MKRTASRVVTAVLVAGSAALGFAPLAHADTSSSLTPSTEGWYQPNPSCATPAGCVTTGALPAAPPTTPPTSPFPARSLHIGLAPGQQETARTYLAVPFSSAFGTITAASLTVPLDVAQADGSNAPETAKVQVCLASGSITAVDGSVDTPPKADCGTSVAAKYVATPQPHLEADLAPLLSDLSSASGLALLPDATKAAATDTWRVVFSAHDRADTAKTAPATVALTVADEQVSFPTVPEVQTLPDSGTPDLTSVAPPVGTGFAPAPSVDAPVTTAAPPTTAPVAAPVVQPKLVTVGYAYPAVWLLPLAFLIIVPAVARALTKDLAPA